MAVKTRRRRQTAPATEAVAEPLTYDVPVAGALLGLSRNSSYEAAARGEIPTIKIGGRILVPRRKFHEQFGI